MRIVELHLRAFGPFTDRLLDLSGGREGLHFIYGRNEAGKSAALRALVALFYGIPQQTRDSFVHDYGALRISARLRHSTGRELLLTRRKGRVNTLLDGSDNPLAESVLEPYTGGVHEELFTTMFGIGHEALLRGGEEILRGGGAVGESLFAAAAGLTHLHDVLQGLEKEAEKLFSPRGTKRSINQAITEYRKLKKESQAASVSSRDWIRQDKALQETRAEKAAVDEEIKGLEAARNHLERLQRALPVVAALKTNRDAWRALSDVRLLPPDFSERLEQVRRRLQSARESRESAARSLDRIQHKIDSLDIPEALLKEAETIGSLREQLGSHRKAFKDCGDLKGQRRQLQADVDAIIRDLRPGLTLAAPDADRLTVPKRAKIRRLCSEHAALTQDLERTSTALEQLTSRIGARTRELEQLESPRDPADLRTRLQQAHRQGNLEEELATARDSRRALEDQAGVELARLGLWSGTLAQLEHLPVPAVETVDRFQTTSNTLEADLKSHSDHLQKTQDRLAALEHDLKQLHAHGTPPTEEDLKQARRRRDQGWDLVRQAWLEGAVAPEQERLFDPDRPLAEAFEKSITEADTVADRLRREADRVATLAALQVQIEKSRAELEAATAEREELRSRLDEVHREWIELWQPASVVPLTPAEMRPWLTRHGKLVQLGERLRSESQRIGNLETRIGQQREILRDSLTALGQPAGPPDETLEALIHRGQAVVEEIRAAAATRSGLEQTIAGLEQDRRQAERNRQTAFSHLERWRSSWTGAVADLGLPATASPEEATVVLEKIEELYGKRDKIDGLESRIRGIERDGEEFAARVREVVARVAPDLLEVAPEAAVVPLNERLSRAQSDAASRARLLEQRAETQATLERAADEIQATDQQLAELCREAGCGESERLEEIGRRSQEAHILRDKLEELEGRLLDFSGGTTVEDFITEADRIDPDTLPSEIAGLTEEIDHRRRHLEELSEQIGRMDAELRAMDGGLHAADQAQQAQAISTRIREDADRYARLRLASSILRREIERYRTENQDPILLRASELFARLTLDSFCGLQTGYDERDRSVLEGVRPSGQSVRVEGMSDGTRDQLYLALRLAGLEKYLETNEPMPLVLDDILINFDDARSRNTLQILDELSDRTQIIFFTHHRHLRELARSTVRSEALQEHHLDQDRESVG